MRRDYQEIGVAPRELAVNYILGSLDHSDEMSELRDLYSTYSYL